MTSAQWKTHGMALLGVLLVVGLGLIGAHNTIERSGRSRAQEARVTNEIVASSLLCQTFRSEYPGLFTIRVFLATYDRQNTGTLLFHLRTAPDAPEDLVILDRNLTELEDNAYHDFQFEPMTGSEGRLLAFCLEVPEGEQGNTIGAWGTTEDAYEDGRTIFQGMPTAGVRDLVFELKYRFLFPRSPAAVARRVAANKPALLGDWRFYVVLVGGYLVLIYLLIVNILQFGRNGSTTDAE